MKGAIRYPALVLLILAPAMLTSCVFSQNRETYYYLFEGAEDPSLSLDSPRFAGTLAVQEAAVSPVFDRRQIVQRTDGPQLSFMSNDLWAVSPSSGLQSMAIYRIREAGLFGAVVPARRDLDAEYLLIGELDRLELDTRGEVPAAVVEMRLQVVTAAGEPVATVIGGGRRELEEATAYRFAVAANALLSEEVDRLMEALREWDGM